MTYWTYRTLPRSLSLSSGRLAGIARWFLERRRLLQLRRPWRFIWNDVAGKNLDDIFGCSYYWCYIKPDVNSPRHQSLLFDIVAGKSHGKDRTNNRNRLEELLGNLPGASLNKSFFWPRDSRAHRLTKIQPALNPVLVTKRSRSSEFNLQVAGVAKAS